MKRELHSGAIATLSIRPIAAAVLAIGIFVVDTITKLEIAVAVFYVVIVLMAVSFCRKRDILLISAVCMILTVLSYFLTPFGSSHEGLVNCIISLSVIGATTYLALKIESAEMHEARAQLAQFARVSTLGKLTASIAHEVNQPLAAVVTSGSACLRWLACQPPNIEKARQAVDRIVTDANRASEVVRRVRDLAKRAPPQKDWLNINETVLEIIVLTRTEVEKHHILLETQLSDDVPLVSADRIQLQQVFLNLIINAIEAISTCGEGPRELRVSSAKDGSNGVLVTVCDSGRGLGPGKLDDIFDAFYSTKPHGMGMGLAVSRSIIEAHGGLLWAKPNEPRGAVFQFTLPTGQEEAS
jgi:signal transduction histidine kinase